MLPRQSRVYPERASALTKNPPPSSPLHPSKCREWKSRRQRAREHRRSERDEAGEFRPEVRTDAEREGDEGRAVALGMADEANLGKKRGIIEGLEERESAATDLVVARKMADFIDEGGEIVHGELADRPV